MQTEMTQTPTRTKPKKINRTYSIDRNIFERFEDVAKKIWENYLMWSNNLSLDTYDLKHKDKQSRGWTWLKKKQKH